MHLAVFALTDCLLVIFLTPYTLMFGIMLTFKCELQSSAK
jgi:hypothetical protein